MEGETRRLIEVVVKEDGADVMLRVMLEARVDPWSGMLIDYKLELQERIHIHSPTPSMH